MRISFEIFPPKSDDVAQPLWDSLQSIDALRPKYVSVTYGAGGSTKDRTLSTLNRLVEDTSIPAAGHLTCVGASRGEVERVAMDYAVAGVTHILALRGDAPGGPGTAYEAHPDGFRSAAEMIAGIKRVANVEVLVSAYPERHPDSPSFDADLDTLASKVEAGASEALTQFFFNNDDYLRFVDRARARGINIPIVAGIMPIQDFRQISGFAAKCGASIPDRLAARFAGLEEDETTRRLVAANVAAEQVLGLVDAGVTDFHFYTMNRPDLAYSICRLLDIHPQAVALAA
jgi:methylenetetrahydrofolate reductase (NADPH)